MSKQEPNQQRADQIQELLDISACEDFALNIQKYQSRTMPWIGPYEPGVKCNGQRIRQWFDQEGHRE